MVATRTQWVAYQINKASFNAKIPVPVVCPICHHAINVGVEQTFALVRDGRITRLEVLFKCPFPDCERVFVGLYEGPSLLLIGGGTVSWPPSGFAPSVHKPREFDPKIAELSPQFVGIYAQAAAAEHSQLDSICGAGYRKGLEFLLKDFIKSKHPAQAKKIEETQIGSLIKQYVEDPLLKIVATRAAWLGNDESHYIRKWPTKDLDDLKKLIDLTAHWIVADILTGDLPVSMPDPALKPNE